MKRTVTAALIVMLLGSGCAIFVPVATPEQVSEQLDECAAKAQQEVASWKPADHPAYTTPTNIEKLFQHRVNICMAPFYIELEQTAG